MKQIITHGGKVITVDDEDYALVSQFRWYTKKRMRKNGRVVYYAMTRVHGRQQETMHRMLLGLTDKSHLGDHRDGNGLNNCRSNIRVADRTTNQWNLIIESNKFGFKGLSDSGKKEKPYRAVITFRSKRIHLGHFHTVQEAARAYDAAAMQYFGEFANLNFKNDADKAA
jgi:hypothetical protein